MCCHCRFLDIPDRGSGYSRCADLGPRGSGKSSLANNSGSGEGIGGSCKGLGAWGAASDLCTFCSECAFS